MMERTNENNVSKSFDNAEEIYKDYRPSCHLKNIFNRNILSYIKNQNENIILDAGCGSGYWMEHLLESVPYSVLRIDGIDISEKMRKIAIARLKNKTCESVVGNANILDCSAPYKYTIIYMIDVVQHIPKINHSQLFSNCFNLLQNDGILVILDKERLSGYDIKTRIKVKLKLVPDYYRTAEHPSFRSLVKIGESCGFKKVHSDKEAYFHCACLKKIKSREGKSSNGR